MGSVVGVTIFLVLLLFGVQVAMNLYATSAVTAVAFDAARDVAEATPVAEAEVRAHALLARFESAGGRLDFEWGGSTDVVVLTVRASRPSLLPRVHFPFETIERTVRVRRERLR